MGGRVRAVLGPTNTGKTHLAMERLAAHHSGVIGFPLRLLARENYDRLVALKGAALVGLITGEEKILPPGARYFACTVEAMPLDRAVEFVAVDEIQLCADPDRGHVFTDRLLHARGLSETMFLGAATIAPLLRRLVPEVEIDTRPRLSQLSHVGAAKLVRLPPRSAIVAFSAAEVYALAEAIRRRRGGCAVVMGRLSPRTRNAQVALYQDKEVDFLVATDAIGMGLNMDVDHVAFAGLAKFDGHRPRGLSHAEIAQVAGRAGRGLRDGSFGTTASAPPLTAEQVAAVENHEFPPIELLAWRNAALDFSSLDTLLDSLQAPPPKPGLARGNDSSDLTTLLALSRDSSIRSGLARRAEVRLLWEVCQVPDFRRLADDSHVGLCARLFGLLAAGARVPDDWIAGQITGLARADGDIDTLMQRLAGIRVWSYIAARADWVADAHHWQGRARAVEELVSDALHERLTARFVDRRSALLMRRLDAAQSTALLSAVTAGGEVIVEGHAVGHVEGFAFRPDAQSEGDARRLVLRAARRALAGEMRRRVGALAADTDAAFVLSEAGELLWHGAPVGRLRPGHTLLRPAVQPLASEFLDGAERERVRARLQDFIDRHIRAELAPLFAAGEAARADPALRGLLHQLVEQGGLAAPVAMPPPARAALKRAGARAGRFALFVPELLKPRPMRLRALLWSVARGCALPVLPAAGLVSVPPPPAWEVGFARAIGWLPAGPVLLRLDVAERIAAELAFSLRAGVAAAPPDLASRMSLRAEHLPAVLRALGVRLLPPTVLDAGLAGPPAPAMLAPLKRPPAAHPPPPAPGLPAGPFAALAALRR